MKKIQLCSNKILSNAIRITEGGFCEWGMGWGKGDGWGGSTGGWGSGIGRPEQQGNENGGGFG